MPRQSGFLNEREFLAMLKSQNMAPIPMPYNQPYLSPTDVKYILARRRGDYSGNRHVDRPVIDRYRICGSACEDPYRYTNMFRIRQSSATG